MSRYTETPNDRDQSRGAARPEAIWVYTAAGGAACIGDMPAARHPATKVAPADRSASRA